MGDELHISYHCVRRLAEIVGHPDLRALHHDWLRVFFTEDLFAGDCYGVDINIFIVPPTSTLLLPELGDADIGPCFKRKRLRVEGMLLSVDRVCNA